MEATAKDWLDSLSAGTCEVNALIKGITELLRRSPEEGWELLSIVDQYYRRGKISATVFATLKSHLQSLLMGKSRREISVPMPRSRNDTNAPSMVSATIPVASVASESVPPAATSTPAAPRAVGASSTVAIGSVLRGRYKVVSVLGHGGTGTVFEAVDLYRLDADEGHEKIAVKVLHPNVLRRPPLFSELRREFQRLQLLSHPNIVRVHEFDRDGETAFFTMEHLSGVLLSRVLAVRESAAVSRAHGLAILRDIAAAIGYAHSRGVVHGDVSPGNVFVCNDGELRVLDFGSNGVATPSFASCQVLEGAQPDARDDVYGIACIAYVLFAGAHPFQELTALNARDSKLKPKRPPALKSRQWRALRSGLSFDRDSRPDDVAAWAAELNPQPPTQRLPALPKVMSATASNEAPYVWPALAALVIVLIGCGWWVSTHIDTFRFAIARFTSPASVAPSAPLAETPLSVATPVSVAPVEVASSTAAAPLPPPAAVPKERVADARPIAPPPVNTVPNPETSANNVPHSPPRTDAGSVSAPTSPGSRARLELTSDDVTAVPADGLVRVMVRRTRSLRGDVSFSWWTESGTAKPGRDFTAVSSHVDQIEDGKNAINLVIPILADPQRRQARSFYVVIDEASPTAAVGPRTLAMVTIPEPD